MFSTVQQNMPSVSASNAIAMSPPTEDNWRFMRDLVAVRSYSEPMKKKKIEVPMLLSLSARGFFKVSDKENAVVDIDRARHFFSGNGNAAFNSVPENVSTYMKDELTEMLCTLDVTKNPVQAMTVAKIQVTTPGGYRKTNYVSHEHNIEPYTLQRGQPASEMTRVLWLSGEQRLRGLTYEEFIPFFNPAE